MKPYIIIKRDSYSAWDGNDWTDDSRNFAHYAWNELDDVMDSLRNDGYNILANVHVITTNTQEKMKGQ